MTQHIDLLGGGMGQKPSFVDSSTRTETWILKLPLSLSTCHQNQQVNPPPSGVLNISFCLHKDHKQPNPLLLSLDLINKYMMGSSFGEKEHFLQETQEKTF